MKFTLFLVSIAFIALSAHATPATNVGDLNSPYPTVEEIYSDCKAAVINADNDMRTFLHSACGRQMNGIFNGYYQILGRVQPVAYPNDPCEKVRQEQYQSLSNVICFPKNTTKDVPIELQFAKDFVAYIDHDKSRAVSKYPAHNIGIIFSQMYRCNANLRGEKK